MYKRLLFFLGLQADAIGVALLVKIGFGASPLGVLIDNFFVLLPLTIGMVSFLYHFSALCLAKILSKDKPFYFSALLYGFLFSLSIEIYYPLFEGAQNLSILLRIPLIFLSLFLIDLCRYFVRYGKGVKLSSVVLIYSVSNRFKLNINHSTKVVSIGFVVLGLIASFFHREMFFYQISPFTAIYVFVGGYFLMFFEKTNFVYAKTPYKIKKEA